MKPTERIIKNIVWLVLEQGFRVGLSLVSTGILAHRFGVEEYGFFQYALALTTVFAAVSFLCGAEVVVPALVKETDAARQQRILGNAFLLRLLAALLAYLLLLVFAAATDTPQRFVMVAILGLPVLINEPFAVVSAWLQSRVHSRPRVVLVMIAMAVKACAVSLLAFAGSSTPAFYALAWCLEPLIIAIGLVYIYRTFNGAFFFGASYRECMQLLKKGLPFWGGLMVMSLFTRLDVMFLKNYSTPQQLGLYTAALQVFLAMTALAPIVVNSVAPLVIFKEASTGSVRRNVLILTLVMAALGLLFAVMGWILFPWVLPLIFGVKFAPAIHVLDGMLLVAILLFGETALNTFLLKQQTGGRVVIKWVGALMAAALGLCWLVPAYGAYGAVAGMALGYLASFAMGAFWLKRATGHPQVNAS